MLDLETATDIALVVGTLSFVACCCLGTLIASCLYNQRRFRPREDSGESIV